MKRHGSRDAGRRWHQCIALPIAAHADVVGSTFEQPLYTVGTIDGQQGWSEFGPYDVEVAGVPAMSAAGLRRSGAACFQRGHVGFVRRSGDRAVGRRRGRGVRRRCIASAPPAAFASRSSELSFQVASAVPDAEQPGAGISVALSNGSRRPHAGRSGSSTRRPGSRSIYSDVPGHDRPVRVPGRRRSPAGCPAMRLTACAMRVPVRRGFRQRHRHAVRRRDAAHVLRANPARRGRITTASILSRRRNGNIVPVIDTALFLARGTAAPATAGAGLLFDDVRVETLRWRERPAGSDRPAGSARRPGRPRARKEFRALRVRKASRATRACQGRPATTAIDGDDRQQRRQPAPTGSTGKDGAAGPAGRRRAAGSRGRRGSVSPRTRSP